MCNFCAEIQQWDWRFPHGGALMLCSVCISVWLTVLLANILLYFNVTWIDRRLRQILRQLLFFFFWWNQTNLFSLVLLSPFLLSSSSLFWLSLSCLLLHFKFAKSTYAEKCFCYSFSLYNTFDCAIVLLLWQFTFCFMLTLKPFCSWKLSRTGYPVLWAEACGHEYRTFCTKYFSHKSFSTSFGPFDRFFFKDLCEKSCAKCPVTVDIPHPWFSSYNLNDKLEVKPRAFSYFKM